MSDKKGEPVFGNIDEILADKIIEHTQHNIDHAAAGSPDPLNSEKAAENAASPGSPTVGPDSSATAAKKRSIAFSPFAILAIVTLTILLFALLLNSARRPR